MAGCGCLSASGYCPVTAALPLTPTTTGHAPPRGGQHLSLGFGVTPPRPEPPASCSQPASPWVCFILVSGTFEGRASAPGPVNSSQEAGSRHIRPGLLGQSLRTRLPGFARLEACRRGPPQTWSIMSHTAQPDHQCLGQPCYQHPKIQASAACLPPSDSFYK